MEVVLMLRRNLAAGITLLLLLTGCSFSRQLHRSSNLMSYLYPHAEGPPPAPAEGVRLRLPLRVGIAFVPAGPKSAQSRGIEAVIPGAGEQRLLGVLRDAFKSRDWVREVVVIPSAYLTPGGGFTNLDQVARMFGTDVVALVSVDQFQSSDPLPVSFLYLSIIGAYVLPLDHNDTATLIDAAVFDVPARTFILRAPGQSHITGHATAVDVSESMRERSQKGLELAMSDLSKNLAGEVDAFKGRVISGERGDVDIVSRDGTSIRKSGSVGWIWALSLLLIAFVRRWSA
jgi:rhombotail lipoprotein